MCPRARSLDRGAALVEFALIAPLLLLLAFGIVDLGRALYTHVGIQEAAQEGALYGAFAPDNYTNTMERVKDSVQNPTLGDANVAVTCVPIDLAVPGDTPDIVVTVTYELDMITPISALLGNSITLRSQVTATIFADKTCDPTPVLPLP